VLTARGRELVARLQRSGGERMAGWMEQMSPDDLAALARGLRALAAVVAGEVTRGAADEGDAGCMRTTPRAGGRDTGRDDTAVEQGAREESGGVYG